MRTFLTSIITADDEKITVVVVDHTQNIVSLWFWI